MASPESSNPSDYLILAINAGSSSLKLSLYTSSGHGHDPRELAVAEISGLSSPPASLKYTIHPKPTDKNSDVPEDITDPDAAFKFLLDKLIADTSLPRVTGHDSIAYACHRIVHGGDFGKVHVIDKSTFHALEELSDLAPLHNATGLKIVRTVHETLPKCTNMAYFDSAFHATIPKHIRAYAIDQKLAERNKLRKYGFHGVSYRFITNAVAEYLEKKTEEVNIIALHLGSGASGCCIQGGKSLDTTMGLTPVSGLPGGTRSGDIDPRYVVCIESAGSLLTRVHTAVLFSTIHIALGDLALQVQRSYTSQMYVALPSSHCPPNPISAASDHFG
jgi:acetate kinase